MVVAGGDGCQRGRRATPRKNKTPASVGRGPARGSDCPREAGEPREPGGNQDWGLKGGRRVGCPAAPAVTASTKEEFGLVAVSCALGTMSSVAVAAAGRFRGLQAPGWRYRADWRRSVRHSAGAFGLLPMLPYRFGRSGRRLGPAAVAANSSPVPISARGNRRGPGAAGERDATRPPYPRGDSRSSLAARNVPGRTWGLPSKRFAQSLPLADAGGRGGPPRPAGRGGQGDQARACTL